MYRAFLPGLGLRPGSEAYLSSNLAGQLSYPPPSASVVQYGYFRGGGYDADAAGLAAAGSFLFPMIGRFVLPCVALVLVILTGEASGSTLLAGALSVVITVVAGIVGYFFLRSEASARWLGVKAQRPLSWLVVKLKRDPIEDTGDKAAELRARALVILREGWALGSIRRRGQPVPHVLDPSRRAPLRRSVGSRFSAVDAFAAFAIAFWAGAVFPITGSGLGVVDAVLIAMLIESSSASDDALLAAALLWRGLRTGHHASAWRDHLEPIPQGGPRRGVSEKPDSAAERVASSEPEAQPRHEAGASFPRSCEVPDPAKGSMTQSPGFENLFVREAYVRAPRTHSGGAEGITRVMWRLSRSIFRSKPSRWRRRESNRRPKSLAAVATSGRVAVGIEEECGVPRDRHPAARARQALCIPS